VLNLYSARHYQTDEALYRNFTEQTGIRINRIELGDEPLLQRLKSEGANSRPTSCCWWTRPACGGRRSTACSSDRFEDPHERIPANLRANDGSWYGFSTRAR